MNWKRTATLGVIGGALAVWLAGATTPDRPVVDTTIAKPTPIELRGAELADEITRLRERLRPVIEPQRPARNLFQFSSRAGAPSSRVDDLPAPAIGEGPAQRVPAAPPLKLVGLAEDPGPDGPVRTAIISGLGQIFFVKEGDSIAGRFRVQHLSGDVVELSDLADSTIHRLALE
jgi:hypothetical protein